jgi:hypothetical protein
MASQGRIDLRDLAPDPANPADKVVCAGLVAAAEVAREAMPPDCGFIMVAVPFGFPPEQGVGRYVGNVNREDAIAILKTLLFRWGINEEWMGKAK